LSHSTSGPYFCDGFLWDKVSRTICLGWLQTVILLISASRVARIIGISHQWPTGRQHFNKPEERSYASWVGWEDSVPGYIVYHHTTNHSKTCWLKTIVILFTNLQLGG
jgi:hypothetical protein